MTYASGADDLADIIELIADGIIASSEDWVDGDATWVTTNKEGDNARRCLKYTGDAADIWLALEALNTSHTIGYISSYYRYAKGLRVTLSASWDDVEHTYPASNHQTFLSFECRYRYSPVHADLATLLITYYLWYDESGFAIIAKPEPDSTDDQQSSFFLAVERVPTKEYADGYTNFYVVADLNMYEYFDDSYDGLQCRTYLRPFNFEYNPSDHASSSSFYNHGVNHQDYVRAMKSNGNGKAYYLKPIYQNEDGVNDPIAEADLWFGWLEERGLIDGDVIAIEGETTKYLCKALDSPDSTNRLKYAIKNVA
jgi:hypothetical protein